jgi:methionyl-tRNA formyltransferase
MRIIFYGTPDIAVPYLEFAASAHDVVAVITQPDRPAGRGLTEKKSPVKEAAIKLGLPVFQPEHPSLIASMLNELGADLGLVVAYGNILKHDILETTRLGHINAHFSILPKYRGASPVAWALAQGEIRTGVTLFWLDKGMDTGPILLTKETSIGPNEDAHSLTERLKFIGIEALKEVLPQITLGRIPSVPQIGEPSYAPILKKEDGRIHFEKSASEIHNLARGLMLWPRAFFILTQQAESPNLSNRQSGPISKMEFESGIPSPTIGHMASLHSKGLRGDKRISVLKTEIGDLAGKAFPAPWGTILRVEQSRGFLLQCGQGSSLWIARVQPEGKNPMGAADFLNGQRLVAGRGLPLKRGE